MNTFKDGWYVLYTKSRAEKQVAERLQKLGLQTYLPTHRVLRQWSDRKKWVTVPLFNSYLFVYLNDDKEYMTTLQDRGAAWFVNFAGKPAIIREEDIAQLKQIVERDLPIESSDQVFEPGTKTYVQSGPMTGLEVEVVSLHNKEKVIVRINSLEQAIMINLPKEDLIPSE